ncbi:hypothetical protein FTUN_0790 [Frigoriglobus tundricola]|uniref:Uncharacterized protein n=1 Tax=Frigoriglobus tundricola TaxID=2774151 RepID=A0A6M5YIB6_9BACT|nr:hypothetical protein FTUN_0790 [Frigoriglobus tundricola]
MQIQNRLQGHRTDRCAGWRDCPQTRGVARARNPTAFGVATFRPASVCAFTAPGQRLRFRGRGWRTVSPAAKKRTQEPWARVRPWGGRHNARACAQGVRADPNRR